MKGLTNRQDAYGHAMLDHFEGRRGFATMIERDDGLVDADFGIEHYFSNKWAAPDREALRHVRGRALDVGAGPGRVALYLQDRGHDVVAVDNSPLAIRICKARGVKRAHVLPFTGIDRRFGRYDSLVMWGNNFGLFGTAQRARWMLRRLKSLTTSDARIVAQSVDVYQTKEPVHLAYHRFNRKRGRLPGELRIRVRYKKYATPWFDYMMVSPAEMQEIVGGTGWFLERAIFWPDSPVYFAVIEKEN